MKQHQYMPDVWGAIMILLTLIVLEVLVGAAFYDLGAVFYYGDPRTDVIKVLAHGVIFSVVMHYTGLTWRELYHPSSQRVLPTILLAAGPIVLIVAGSMWWMTDVGYGLLALFPPDPSAIDWFAEMMKFGPGAFIVLCIVAPLLEEMLFRGIILRGFLNHYPADKAILLSAALFGVAHMNVYQGVTATILGWFLGLLFVVTRSLWPCILAHAAYNGCIYFFYVYGYEPAPNSGYVTGGTLAVSLLGIYWLHRLFRPSDAGAQSVGE